MSLALVVGATGATGRLVVEQLLGRGHKVKAIVRSPDRLPDAVKSNENLTVVTASLLDLSDDEMVKHVQGCSSIVSCLGHNMTFKGLFGHPRNLCFDATRKLCTAVQSLKPSDPVKFMLMNTTGAINPDGGEQETRILADRIVISTLSWLLPPQRDNERAAEYLRSEVGQDNAFVKWVVVRPDALIDEDVSEYDVHPSPLTSCIFNAGSTSRANVAHFMCELIDNPETFNKWSGDRPVIINAEKKPAASVPEQ